jgi:hypothetical protein
MQPLIDGDILAYEIGSIAQFTDEETGEIIPRPWDWVVETIDNRINDICNAVGASRKPLIYLTGDTTLYNMKRRVRPSLPIYEPNFRIAMAVSKDYKGGRKLDKPLYYNSIRAYLVGCYNAFVAIGCEADDEMAIEQTRRFNINPELCDTIICTRDKDLRQVPGWHYGWECGRQGEFGPTYYDELGTIILDRSKSQPKIVGGGFAFFCSQLLTGDIVDNIGGLKGYGPVKVYDALGTHQTTASLLDAVRSRYTELFGEAWKDNLREQANLLWMVRERDEEGKLIMFNPKDYMNG